MHSNVRKAINNRRGHSFKIEFDGGERLYEVRLFVRARDRVLVVIRPQELCDQAAAAGGRFVDTLTGLATRERFLIELENVLAEARLREHSVGLLCVDIDRFSQVNDALGRKVGDDVLRIVAKRIDGCFRGGDRVSRIGSHAPARIGGDEFMLVLGNITSREDMAAVAARIGKAFAEPVHCSGVTLTISPSIGMAMFPRDGTDAESLFGNVRAALDEARDRGAESGVFFTKESETRAFAQLDLKRELRWALEQRHFELHYLPRVDLRSGTVQSLEALLRWRHPVRGLVPMSEVIPLAETTGMMRSIGEWVLDAACSFAAQLGTRFDSAPSVSINLSHREFTRPDLPQLIAGALDTHGLPGSGLQLEFGEASLMRSRTGVSMLHTLKALGVQLVIDDFGTGYVSLLTLRTLPLDGIKIDRSLVAGIGADADRESICAAIAALGRELGLAVVAEGVETPEQVDFAMERCDAAQGYHYSRPLPADEVVRQLQGSASDAEAHVA